MKKIFLLVGALFICNSSFATSCTAANGYLITDAASCPCGYIAAGTVPAGTTCGTFTGAGGNYTWICS